MAYKSWKNRNDCIIDALKYSIKSEWIKNSNAAYISALKNGWISDCCMHMIKPEIWNKKWTKETCIVEAKKYSTRNDFRKKSSGAYDAARDNNWLDEICLHMIVIGNLKRRCIYSYEFSDNCVYVGLTYDIYKRNINRKSNENDQVTKHIKETQLEPILKQLTEYVSVDYASKLEEVYIQSYKMNGWNVLNRIKGGGIGGNSEMWTYNNCKEEALKFNYRNDFKKNSGSAYRISLKNKWLNEICEHMSNKYVTWSFEKCREAALNYNTKSDFRKNVGSAYSIAYNNKWLNDICQHMIIKKKPNSYWSKERCILEAEKYKTINEFRKKSKCAYVTIINSGWLSDISFLEKYVRI